MKNWIKHQIYPRVPWLFYSLSILVTAPIKIWVRLTTLNSEHKSTKLMLEAGINGWNLIEYKELYASACEYLGAEKVIKTSIDRNKNYYTQLRENILKIQPTHFVYDPRTGSDNTLQAILESFRISILLCAYSVTPIVVLTDFSLRIPRIQASIVSCWNGVVVNYLSARLVGPIFPHRRLIGPHLMPMSNITASKIKAIKEASEQNTKYQVLFMGTLYEPRRSTLIWIQNKLNERNIIFEIKGRDFNTERPSDEEYWTNLCKAKIIITTSEQGSNPELVIDWRHINHMIYRYLEATLCGALLIAPNVPGVDRFFTPDVHFVAFSDKEDAIEKVEYYVNNKEACAKVAEQGHRRALQLIESRAYWMLIDSGLCRQSLT